MSQLTYEVLRDAVGGQAVALRSRLKLQPAGGPGDKVFPPTYQVDGQPEHKYVVEKRQIGDEESPTTTVLLDSVASQANRAELALLEGWERRELLFPVPYVDFSDSDLTDYDKLTVLEAPHRIADAIFRDSLLNSTLFRLSDIGQSITDATPRNATEMFRYAPSSLLFGMWDSTGPKGGLGSKFQRAYVSEIVGFDAQPGKKVRSRLDPLHIEKVAAEDRAFNSADSSEVWTFDPEQAELDKKQNPKYASRGSDSGEAGQPSKINHGNIVPSIDSLAGGVTISNALQTTVVSFAALRRLRFKGHGENASRAAHTAIAALGLAAIAYQIELDFDLRSRCLLLPMHRLSLELVTRDGSESQLFEVDRLQSADILRKASEQADREGLGWESDNIRLSPAPKMLELIRRSRKVSISEPEG